MIVPRTSHAFYSRVSYDMFPLKNGERMDEASSIHIMRQMMVVGCEPGAVGAMCGGASPLDPIFWVLHAAFEKAQHILMLSPSYRETYDMTWVNGTCDGSKLGDKLPFTGTI